MAVASLTAPDPAALKRRSTLWLPGLNRERPRRTEAGMPRSGYACGMPTAYAAGGAGHMAATAS